ncbi:GDP-D-glucose phosphorylase 1-like isoform X2 [Corticium candelabrum]|uniref:GDP-D-glucose phosphorylase 1-like isoform X2 n=1 Tax=Corticium candelabrum TaxID=121492 RepID=UPI002E26BE40|nr:GDP-D-glucose phosphorylase 1-like isoform X2 [Corticium candelabrum]
MQPLKLNTQRALQRRPPQHMAHLDQPFDPKRFNFTAIDSSEVLFNIVNKLDGSSVSNDKQHVVVVNVSPLEYCNVLLIPRLEACLPQVLTVKSLELAILFALSSSSRSLRVAFNSLCAFASVNHLHYHGYYLDRQLPCEQWATSHVAGPCHELVNYPAKGFVFYYEDEGGALHMGRSIHKVSHYLHSHNIAHNLMITRGHIPTKGKSDDKSLGLRAVLWPRKSSIGVKSSSAFNTAVCELAGHLPIYNEDDYYTMTDERACRILGETSVSENHFQIIRRDVKDMFNNF